MANEKSPRKKNVGKSPPRSAKKKPPKKVAEKKPEKKPVVEEVVVEVPEPVVEPVKPAVEPAVLGSPASLGQKDPANDDLKAIVKEAIASKCNATVYVKSESDVNAVYDILCSHDNSSSIGVGVRENLHARATWRRKVE